MAAPVLSACGGGTTAVTPPTAVQAQPASQGPAASASSIIEVADAALPSAPASTDDILRAPRVELVQPTSARRSPQLMFGPAFSETVGWKTSAGGPYTGVFGFHTAYASVPLTAYGTSGEPARQISIEAPMTRAPGGSCLTVGARYVISVAGSDDAFVVENRCTTGLPTLLVDRPIDATFLDHYVRRTPSMLPSYAFALVALDAVPSASTVWYVVLYNYRASHYDVVATYKGSSPDRTAASEYRYTSGEIAFTTADCNTGDPPIGAQQLTFFRLTRFLFSLEAVSPAMEGLTTSAEPFNPKGCFATGAYKMSPMPPFSTWTVRDLH